MSWLHWQPILGNLLKVRNLVFRGSNWGIFIYFNMYDDDDAIIENWAYLVNAITINYVWRLKSIVAVEGGQFTFPHHNHCTFGKLSSFTSPISNL
ncbi:hypothetical protein N7527_007522 [Penicillium freii]|uniref:Uncharacterized protein n=1 Tax=Penicillium freii TaxID=48697 RepID=A0A101MMC4_PENFR|nr:hypothetical protein N7527_007522 [Penicillium freii]KUM63189.1 hypothetical protein ACN42_g3931 [Penicillium freii]